MTGFDTAIHTVYLACAVCFVLGLHLMTAPATARRGNQLSAAGMAAAVATTVVVLVHDARITAIAAATLAATLTIGVVMTLPIGGADMPVVISLLTAFTGPWPWPGSSSTASR